MKPSPTITDSCSLRRLARATWCPSCLTLLAALAGGCGPSTGVVFGTVTFEHEKVPSGTVSVFVAGTAFEGKIEDGSYQISGVPLGEARVAVARFDPGQPDPYEALNKARAQVADRTSPNPREISPSVVTDPVQLERLQRKRHLLPFIYASPGTSGLRLTINAGANSFDIQLRDRPNSR